MRESGRVWPAVCDAAAATPPSVPKAAELRRRLGKREGSSREVLLQSFLIIFVLEASSRVS